ncbi:MAG: hypothetical protein JSR82_12230 [Verrucomicrobia bacterium]|nr:hypothetical protein [Verrucomicrobiota bacterium]
MPRPLTALFGLLLGAYLAVVGWQSWSAPRLSPDSLNYVTVARAVAAGQGLQQPTLGFNQPGFAPDAAIPTPFTGQAPGYPLAIAAVAALGPSADQAAALVALLGWAALLGAMFLCAREVGGREAGWWAVGLLLLQAPVRRLAMYAWSETMACAFLLGGVWLLLRRRPLLGGMLAGLAFATRYALLPAGLLAGCCLLIWARGRAERLRAAAAYGVGLALPTAVVLGRNRALSGYLLPPANASDLGFEENLWQGSQALVECLLGGLFGTGWEMGLLALCALMALVAVTRRPAALRPVLAEGRWSLWVWPLGYFGFLVLQRTWTHFDELGPRLVAPTALGVTLPLALLLPVLWPRGARWAGAAACACLAAVLVAEARKLPPPERAAPRPARMALVQAHLRPGDLLVGDDVIGLVHALRLPAAVNFSRHPYSDRPSYEFLDALRRGQSGRFRRLYLVLGRDGKTPELWELAFGSCFADLVRGQEARYPGIRLLAQDAEGWLFALEAPGSQP